MRLILLVSFWQFANVEGQSVCEDAYECADRSSATSTSLCWGESSCSNVGNLGSTYIDCYGAYSCQGSTFLIRGQDCSGAESCRNATFGDEQVYCWGHQSCSDSNILAGDDAIQGYGSFAFKNSIIDSTFGGLDSGNMYGYLAGYDATFTCVSGDTCTLTCKGNSCYKMNFICAGNGCTIDCNETSTDCPIMTGSGTYTVYDMNKNNITNYSDPNYDTVAGHPLVDEEIWNRTNVMTQALSQDICTRNTSVVCDAYLECNYETINFYETNGNGCCRGDNACFGYISKLICGSFFFVLFLFCFVLFFLE